MFKLNDTGKEEINENLRDMITTLVICSTYIGGLLVGGEMGYLYMSLFMVHAMFFFMTMKGSYIFKADTLLKIAPIVLVGFLCTNSVRGLYQQGLELNQTIEENMLPWMMFGLLPAFIHKIVHNIMVKKANGTGHND